MFVNREESEKYLMVTSGNKQRAVYNGRKTLATVGQLGHYANIHVRTDAVSLFAWQRLDMYFPFGQALDHITTRFVPRLGTYTRCSPHPPAGFGSTPCFLVAE
eukprot:TRINITY_DN61652_c0_g1_i1.p1 TRINITY_DN61652_c0_g1~~TRINITY_DN61652_c0_g1_i1.p1  ORF type:complete len:103 (+),score=5.56 TRINITY_DN61652_c0_g1_i1:3-311(+)